MIKVIEGEVKKDLWGCILTYVNTDELRDEMLSYLDTEEKNGTLSVSKIILKAMDIREQADKTARRKKWFKHGYHKN